MLGFGNRLPVFQPCHVVLVKLLHLFMNSFPISHQRAFVKVNCQCDTILYGAEEHSSINYWILSHFYPELRWVLSF